MRFSKARYGRTFVVRLEDGEVLHETLERFARRQRIGRAWLIAFGGADRGSRLVVGPANGRAKRISPMETTLRNVHEVAGVGTIFPDSRGRPVLHLHAACGRRTSTVTGCVRRGVKVWHVMEVVVQELTNSTARRAIEKASGFELLQP